MAATRRNFRARARNVGWGYNRLRQEGCADVRVLIGGFN
jgi:hypothetical protein